MIYISSNCIKGEFLCGSVEVLADAGFKNIELSYGGEYVEDYETRLMSLKAKHGLEYCCHNYFMPVKEPIVVNLASLNNEIFAMSLDYLQRAIALSAKLGSKKYGFHAGFLVDVAPNELGNALMSKPLSNRQAALERFSEGYSGLFNLARESGLELYVENNVFSLNNSKIYNGKNPFLLTSYHDCLELKRYIEYKLLLDVAHLKVSCNTSDVAFAGELSGMLELSDYLHLSENDGRADSHQPFNSADSRAFEIILAKRNNINTLTLETRGAMADVVRSYELVKAHWSN